MAIESVENLLTILRRVELISPEQADQIQQEFGPYLHDPQTLGEYLVELDWLTAYQLHLVLAGEWKHLTVGPYQILDRLGEGGISEVFKAWDTSMGRVVALKVLRRHLADQSDALRQFQRELEVVTRLSHPNIIKTYDANEVDNLHYFAMEYVEGMDLRRFVERFGPLPVHDACEYVRQVAQGLQHAHQLGLVHRDIKPANLFLINPPMPGNVAQPRRRQDSIVKIIDWGLSRLQARSGEGSPEGGAGEEKGQLMGTADYIAPEQALDASLVDIRADIYSLGCTLYYLLAGQPPFPGNSLMQKLMQHREAEPPSLLALREDVLPELEDVYHRMMSKKPEDRFHIPLLVAGALRHFCTPRHADQGASVRSSTGVHLRPPTYTALSPMRPPTVSKLPMPNENEPRSAY